MSKYVKHKHGMTIGSDNVFFVIDTSHYRGQEEPPLVLPEGVEELRDDYRAILSFDGYSFDHFNTVNVFVRTPAFQVCFDIAKLEWKRDWEHKGQIITIPMSCNYYVLTKWAESWLNTQVGEKYKDWDTYTRGNILHPCLFFKKRGDAVAFVKMVESMLKGMKYGH